MCKIDFRCKAPTSEICNGDFSCVKYEVHVSRGTAGIEKDGNTLRVHTRQDMIANRANIDVIRQLAKYFSVDPASIRIISGARSRRKVIEIPDEVTR